MGISVNSTRLPPLETWVVGNEMEAWSDFLTAYYLFGGEDPC